MKTTIILVLLLVIPFAYADLMISEVMNDPSAMSDTALEWIELYNNYTKIDLSECTIDGSDFEDIVIEPFEFIVIARTLTSDTGASFEGYYGNNNTIWDETDGNYKAVDGSFSLNNGEDLIFIECSDFNVSLNYTEDFPSEAGYSMEKIDLNGNDDVNNWRLGKMDGSPGYYDDSVDVVFNVTESNLEITSFSMHPDDLEEEGIQILPLPGQKKRIYINATSSSRVSNVKAEFNNEVIILESNGNKLEGYFDLYYDLSPGNYTIEVYLEDNNKSSLNELEFEYLPLLASSLDTKNLDFGNVKQGLISEIKNLKIKNLGNVNFNIEVSGTDFSSGDENINADSLEFYFSNNWNPLTKIPSLFLINLKANDESNLDFRVKLNENTAPDEYEGKVTISAVEE
ncbi:MAG: hypothetical protein PHE43_02635 [Candidatus Nanoarchaeia archaeon]|nr:hypothetical protein [Candidatus Nanoarchaeia archaeon]